MLLLHEYPNMVSSELTDFRHLHLNVMHSTKIAPELRNINVIDFDTMTKILIQYES